MTADLTPHQRHVLNVIRTFQFELRYSPSLKDLADILGFGKNAVAKTVKILCAKGVIERTPIGTIKFPADSLRPEFFTPSQE